MLSSAHRKCENLIHNIFCLLSNKISTQHRSNPRPKITLNEGRKMIYEGKLDFNNPKSINISFHLGLPRVDKATVLNLGRAAAFKRGSKIFVRHTYGSRFIPSARPLTPLNSIYFHSNHT